MPITRHPLMPLGPDDLPLRRVRIDDAACERLNSSMRALASEGARFVAAFYTTLFERYPGVRAMFPSDMQRQERKLLDSLLMVIEHMRDPDRVGSMLQDLGRKHAEYGARPEHYPIVCSILIECMARQLGRQWSEQLEAEWTQALSLVSHAMINADKSENARPESPRTKP